jgi:hypothetical protein
MSLLKYVEEDFKRKSGNSGEQSNIHFHRADIDGMPYRGKPYPLKEEEYEELAETVHDGCVDVFDLAVPEQKKKLEEIVEGVTSGWWRLKVFDHHWVDSRVLVFCVWTKPFKQIPEHKLPQH